MTRMSIFTKNGWSADPAAEVKPRTARFTMVNSSALNAAFNRFRRGGLALEVDADADADAEADAEADADADDGRDVEAGRGGDADRDVDDGSVVVVVVLDVGRVRRRFGGGAAVEATEVPPAAVTVCEDGVFTAPRRRWDTMRRTSSACLGGRKPANRSRTGVRPRA